MASLAHNAGHCLQAVDVPGVPVPSPEVEQSCSFSWSGSPCFCRECVAKAAAKKDASLGEQEANETVRYSPAKDEEDQDVDYTPSSISAVPAADNASNADEEEPPATKKRSIMDVALSNMVTPPAKTKPWMKEISTLPTPDAVPMQTAKMRNKRKSEGGQPKKAPRRGKASFKRFNKKPNKQTKIKKDAAKSQAKQAQKPEEKVAVENFDSDSRYAGTYDLTPLPPEAFPQGDRTL